MSQSYVWVVSWRSFSGMKYKVFTNKVRALSFKYSLENRTDCFDVELQKRHN